MKLVGVVWTRGLFSCRRAFIRNSQPFDQLPLFSIHQQIHTKYFTMAHSNDRGFWTASRVRNTFFEYFKKNGHTFGEKTQIYSVLC